MKRKKHTIETVQKVLSLWQSKANIPEIMQLTGLEYNDITNIVQQARSQIKSKGLDPLTYLPRKARAYHNTVIIGNVVNQIIKDGKPQDLPLFGDKQS